ncbi:hypothetical protein IJ425_04070 [bacterium]|nr:hypothetical protein [bacterium]
MNNFEKIKQMSDKQMHSKNPSVELDKSRTTATSLIIDGVDVSECKDRYLGWDNSTCQNTGNSCPDLRCENNPKCYYKQLKREEQECERLKRDYFKQNEWLQEQKKELDQLKKENKKLKNEIKDLEDLAEFKTETIRELKKELEATKGLVTVGNKQLTQVLKENEELKKKKEENTTFYLKRYANKDSECLDLQHKANILKQTLTEIKEIAEQLYYQAIKDPVKRETAICKIISKINEVDNEN